LVATYHGYWPLKSRVNRLFLRWFCQRIYPVSKAVETELMTIFSNGERRVQTIPLGVNTRFLEPLPPRQEARRHLGLPLVRPIVLHVARFQTIKGHHHLLDALALMVKEKGDSAPLVLFVGDVLKPPSKEELDCKARIECRAALPDLQPHVHFLGHRRDVPLIMRAADVVVSPSDFESFGMSLIEAMTVGTPVVATDAGGPSEIIEHGKTGLLVRPGDSGALAAGIRQVLAHSESSARMADAGREVALSRYCPQRRCATLLQEYRDLMGQRTVTKRETQL
jgi:glycosyltransferase involved in cell wall biosynthesis